MLLYIDPGTGSMLFTVILGALGTLFFAGEAIVLKIKFLLTGGKTEAVANKIPIVIFSDGKQYWQTFKPICDEFEKRKIAVEFWTASEDDKALAENYEYVKVKFIGRGNKAYAKLNIMNALICLATTPGLDVYQWKRSKKCDFYVHVLHAVNDAWTYRMFGLDHYDAVLFSGEYQIPQLRQLEQMRNLPAKDLQIAGSVYMDSLKERLERECATNVGHSGPLDGSGKKTVLLAPSWGPSAILSRFGKDIISALMKTSFNIIVRPHPQCMVSEKNLIEGLVKEFPDSDRLTWDFSPDNFETLKNSDIMISDFSGVIYDFTLVFNKPIIYADTSFDPSPYDAWFMNEEMYKFQVLPKLGKKLDKIDFENLEDVISDVINSPLYEKGRAEARDKVWQNRSKAAEFTVDYIVQKSLEIKDSTKTGKVEK